MGENERRRYTERGRIVVQRRPRTKLGWRCWHWVVERALLGGSVFEFESEGIALTRKGARSAARMRCGFLNSVYGDVDREEQLIAVRWNSAIKPKKPSPLQPELIETSVREPV